MRRAALVALAAMVLAVGWLMTRPDPLPVPEAYLREVVRAAGVPGGVIAWGRPGAAPEVRATGLADPATGRAMRPDDRFRLASLTKPVVAAVLHRLAAEGRLRLDAPLADTTAAPEGVTVAQAIAHLGGWDRDLTGDPFFLADAELARRFGVARAETCLDLASIPAFRELRHPPGTVHAYSNVGYCWLGAAIEAATGAPWIDAARAVGGAALSLDPATITVAHAATPESAALPVTRPGVIGPAGGLIGDAATVLAFTLAQADARAEDDAAAAVATATASPGSEGYYGLGWRVWPRDGATFYTHYGAMPGSFGFAIRRAGGGAAVLLFNGAMADPDAAARTLAEELMAMPDWQ